ALRGNDDSKDYSAEATFRNLPEISGRFAMSPCRESSSSRCVAVSLGFAAPCGFAFAGFLGEEVVEGLLLVGLHQRDEDPHREERGGQVQYEMRAVHGLPPGFEVLDSWRAMNIPRGAARGRGLNRAPVPG